MELQVMGWRYIKSSVSEVFPTRQAAREALAERESIHPSYADKFVFPDTLNTYDERDPA